MALESVRVRRSCNTKGISEEQTEKFRNLVRRSPTIKSKVGSPSRMRRPERIGSFRSSTMALASRMASSLRRKQGSAPASSRRFRISSTPRLRLRPARRARPCRLLTPLSRRKQSEPRELPQSACRGSLRQDAQRFEAGSQTGHPTILTLPADVGNARDPQ
jgi:hypothetical protein